ncbi:tripartite tricarboxylate transporter TctB family protein [Nocardiopsis sp. CC223A]|uniref:tripartite tricarboxylate transporter TctB family protein n=1 Tax=Nocardiopsis sp. CC223A TaxID=3044051 RepID=UPI00278C2419|nr:tripartite tricarboxylate transporter TctB family protein [Nocardiopsis sp. CC223A]
MENEESRSAGRGVREAVGLVGAGLVGGALVLAAINTVRFPPRGEELTTPDGSLWWAAAVVLGVIVLVVVRHGAEEDGPGPAVRLGWPRTVFLLAAGALLVYAAITAFSTEVFSWTAAPQEYRPDPTGVSLWAVTLAIALGTLLMAAAARRPKLRPWRGCVPPLAAGLALVVVFELGLGAAAVHQPTEHTVADAFPQAPAPVPGDVTRVGWQWTAPQGLSVQAVEPGPFGPLLVLQDGVVALDGSSGSELWSYRHPYNAEVRTVVSDGGTRAVLTREPAADRSGGHHVTEIDTATGRILREFTVPPLAADDEDTRVAVLDATSQVRLVSQDQDDNGPRVEVRAADSNERLWSPTVPEPQGRACSNFGWTYGKNLVLHEDQVLITYVCADQDRLDPDTTLWLLTYNSGAVVTRVVAAFDARTGQERWVREWEETYTDLGISVHSPIPGTDAHPVVVVRGHRRTDAPRVLDARDGTAAAQLPPESMESPTEMNSGFEHLVRADSQGTVLLSSDTSPREEGEGYGPYLFQRVSASGEVTDTAQMAWGTVYLDDLPSAVALADVVVVPHLEYEETGTEQTIPTMVVVPSGAAPDEVRFLRFKEPEFTTDPNGIFGDRPGEHRAVPVPGAVVAYVHNTDPATVYGLVG